MKNFRLKLVFLEDSNGKRIWTEEVMEGRFPTAEACMKDAAPYLNGRMDYVYAYPVMIAEGTN